MAQLKQITFCFMLGVSLIELSSALRVQCFRRECLEPTTIIEPRNITRAGNEWSCQRETEQQHCESVRITPCVETDGCYELTRDVCGCMICARKENEHCGSWVADCESHLKCVDGSGSDRVWFGGVCVPKEATTTTTTTTTTHGPY